MTRCKLIIGASIFHLVAACGLSPVAFADPDPDSPGTPAAPGDDNGQSGGDEASDGVASDGDDGEGETDNGDDEAGHPAAAECAANCAARTTCGQTTGECEAECEAQWTRDLDDTGQLCADAWRGYVACQAELSCEAYATHTVGEPDEHPTFPCEGALVSYRRACGNWTTVWFPCEDGSSIADANVCDGKNDCPAGDDEGAGALCFTCMSGGVVPFRKQCDEVADCGDGSDEGPLAGCEPTI